jgi:hypothetical protein
LFLKGSWGEEGKEKKETITENDSYGRALNMSTTQQKNKRK